MIKYYLFVFVVLSKVDSALLRPGRLDKLIHIDFPTPVEQLSILKVLSRKLNTSVDFKEAIRFLCRNNDTIRSKIADEFCFNGIDFKEVSLTNYTGSDLQSLITTSQLIAVKENIKKTTNDDNMIGTDSDSSDIISTPIVTAKHLFEAVKQSKPSIPALDRARFKSIYSQFQHSRRRKLRCTMEESTDKSPEVISFDENDKIMQNQRLMLK